MGKLQVQFCPLSLAHLASVEISKHLWAHHKVREIIKSKVTENLPRQRYTDDNLIKAMSLLKYRDTNEAILTEVLDKMNQLQLPKPAKAELATVVRSMGGMLWEWLERVNWWVERPQDWHLYVDHIRWSYNGCLDTPASIRSMYFSRKLEPNYATWTLLCNHCVEDCIKDMWPKAKLLKGHKINAASIDSSVILFKKFSYILPFYWYCKMQNKLEDVPAHFQQLVTPHRETYDKCYTVEENMFNISRANENASAVRYFWTFMDESQRSKQIRRLATPRGYEYYIDIFDYRTDVDFIIFFWERISATNDCHFLILATASNQVMRKLNNWPWEESFLQTLLTSLDKLQPSELEKLICSTRSTLRQKMRDDDKESCDKWRSLTFMIWEAIPIDVKRSLNYRQVLEKLFFMEDIEFLDCIINCEDLKEQRHGFLNFDGEQPYGRFSTVSGNDITEAFCEKVLRNDEERKEFMDKVQMHPRPNLIFEPVFFHLV